MIPNIKNFTYEQKRTGFFGVLGNKGNFVINFTYNKKSIGLASGHLSCGEENEETRIKELKGILNSTCKNKHVDKFSHNNYWFIFGDLNFRVEMGIAQCVRLIKERNVGDILLKDQLLKLMKTGLPVNEARIGFMPTFKFIKGTNEYNLTKRTPSYCDRILYGGKDKLKVKCLSYKTINIYFSDHKPVVGLFEIEV